MKQVLSLLLILAALLCAIGAAANQLAADVPRSQGLQRRHQSTKPGGKSSSSGSSNPSGSDQIPGKGTVEDPFVCPDVGFDAWNIDFELPSQKCYTFNDTFDLSWKVVNDTKGDKTVTGTTAIFFYLECLDAKGDHSLVSLTYDGTKSVATCATDGHRTMTVLNPKAKAPYRCGILINEARSNAEQVKAVGQQPVYPGLNNGEGFKVAKSCS